MRLGIGSHAFRWAAGWGEVVSPEKRTSSAEGPDFVPRRRMGIARFVEESLDIPGVQGIQVCDNLVPERLTEPGEDRRKVEAALAQGFFVELGAGSTGPEYLVSLLELSKQFGADVLRVLAVVHRDERGKPVGEELAQAERDLKEVLPTARRLGVRLAIENHWELPGEELLELVRRIDDDHLGICLDTANPICGGEDPVRTVELLAPFAINVHLKDYRITRDLASDPAGYRIVGAALGEGWLPVEEVVETIRTKSQAKTCHVELFLDQAETELGTLAWERDAVRRSVENARRLLAL